MSDTDELSVVISGREVGLTNLLRQLESALQRTDSRSKTTAESIGGGLASAEQRAANEAIRTAQAIARLDAAQGNAARGATVLRAALEGNAAASQRVQLSAQAQAVRLEQLATQGSFAQQALGGLNNALNTLGVAVAVPALLSGAAALAQQGAQADLVTRRFNTLAEAAGNSGAALLNALRAASGGEISDLNLQLAANRANLLGVADSAEQMSILMGIARDRAQYLGITATDAFNDLVTGLGRGSAEILDNLAITVDADTANKAYADTLGKTVAQLTEAEKKQALINQVLSQGKASLAETGGAAESSAGAMQRLASAGENAATKIGAGMANVAVPGINALASALQSVADGFSVLTTLTDRVNGAYGAAIQGSAGFAEYQQRAAELSAQLGQVGAALPPLTEAQYQYAKSLIDTGTSADEAVAKARGLGQELGTISAAQQQLVQTGDASAASAANLAGRLVDLVAVGGPVRATAAALADGYVLGSISADQLTAALAQLEQAQIASANAANLDAVEQIRLARGAEEATAAVSEEAAAIGQRLVQEQAAAEQAERLAEVKERINGLAGQVSGGYLTMADAARILAGEIGIAADEAARLIANQTGQNVQATFAAQRNAREERAAGAGPQQASAGALAFVAREETAAREAQKRRAAITRGGGRQVAAAAAEGQREIESQEAKHQQRLADIAADGARKRAEAERKYDQSRLDSRADFYAGLADEEDQQLAQQLSAQYEQAAAQAAEIARTQGADAADAYLAAATQAIERQAETRRKIAEEQAKGDEADQNKIAYLQGVLALQEEADNNRLKQIQESGSAIAAEQARQYSEAEAQYAAHLDRLDAKAREKGVTLGQTLLPTTGGAGATGGALPVGGGTGTGAAPGGPGGAAGGVQPVADVATPAAVDAQTARLGDKLDQILSAVQAVESRVSAVERAIGKTARDRATSGG